VTDYADAGQVFGEIDRRTAEVEARLAALTSRLASVKPFADSVRADHLRFARDREALRRRLGVAAAAAAMSTAPADAVSLPALRGAQEALVHAHAEGLPALRDPFAVDVLAGHMVELSRHLTVIELWLEGEEDRG
jgi:predicted outer membrane protein